MRLVTEGADPIYSFGMPDAQAPPPQSLSFSLMAAARHMELGEFQAGITAICDSLWIAHGGRHEQMTDLDMVSAIRRIGGFGWAPPEDRA